MTEIFSFLQKNNCIFLPCHFSIVFYRHFSLRFFKIVLLFTAKIPITYENVILINSGCTEVKAFMTQSFIAKNLSSIFSCLLYIFILFFAYVIVAVLLPFKSINPNIIIGLSMLFALFIYTKIFKSINNEIHQSIRYTNPNLLIMLYFIIAAVLFNALCTAIILQFSSFELIKNYLASNATIISNDNFALNFFIIAIFTPIFEEFLFRGYIQTTLSKQFSIGSTLVLQAFIYSLLHWDIVQSTYTFFLGIVLGMIMLKFKTLLAPIFFHVSFNGSNLIMNIVFQNMKLETYYGGVIILFISALAASFLYINKNKNYFQKLKNLFIQSCVVDGG